MSEDTTDCPECDGKLQADGDETVCSNCGLVVDSDPIDHGPEWRSFNDSQTNPERTGAPLTVARHDRGLSTEIGYDSGLSEQRRRQFVRLRRQHNRARVRSKRERNQIYAFTEIRRLSSEESLPTQVRDHACSLFKSAQAESLLRGRSLEGFAAACVYAACRIEELSRTVEETVTTAKADRGEFQAAYDALNRELGLPVAPTSPAEYLPRYATELELSSEIERRARELVERTQREGIANGRNPSGVAAACLYTAAKEADAELTQQEAADIASVTPVTLRNTFQALAAEPPPQ
ncbi:transcription initiation factor IIB family protein [Halonotius terrestris]|uniref:Transcription initiation factor IIB n=1 Tax=Halonotius terrestris TaxID=2487750 RepID=A0A8J8PFN5_9EURY|nr:transcription initiation factor IIB family protein [Halonotius terrestris]TQQ83777.1 transcription initiation factor IIB family protein [Halonotius terrestris]